MLTNAAKRRKYDSGESLSDLVAGFWENLTEKMRGKNERIRGNRARRGGTGLGRGLSLAELAKQEAADTGIKPDAFLLGGSKKK